MRETRATTSIVVRENVRIWTERFAADGPACLLVGGAGAISAFWPDTLCEGLATSGYRVIRYDHRDAGNSSFIDWGRNPYRLEDLLDDAMAVLDAHGVRSAHLVGHSMGGFIVQLAAVHHSDRLLSLTSMSSHTSSPGLPEPPARTWEILLANRPTGDLDRDLAGYMSVWRHLNAEAPFDAAMAERYTTEIYARNPATLPATNHVALQSAMTDRGLSLGGVNLPALVIHGEFDPLVPIEGAMQTTAALRGSRLVTVPRAGHMFFDEGIWEALLRELLSHFRAADRAVPARRGDLAGPTAGGPGNEV